jgi:hypothetical protein
MQSLFSSSFGSFSFVISTTSSSGTITIPVTSRVGDFAILFDVIYSSGISISGEVVPSGWNSISRVSTANIFGPSAIRSIVSYKVLTSGNPGSTITGMSDDATRKILLIFRPESTISSVTPLSVNGQATSINPSTQTITASDVIPPILVFAHWGADGNISSRSVSGITMNEVGNTTNQYCKYQIFNNVQNLNNADIDMSSSATVKALQSFYVQFT